MGKKLYKSTNAPLGLKYSKAFSEFSLWAVQCEAIYVAIYDSWDDIRKTKYQLNHIKDNLWHVKIDGDLEGKYYTFIIQREGIRYETIDPYSYSTGPNTTKSGIIDLQKTNPDGFLEHKRPNLDRRKAVIYEMSVRDMTSMSGGNFQNAKKFVGLYENNAYKGVSVGLDHITQLGVSYIHLMPVMDFASVDDLSDDYNWGYDPVLFNVPEGTYSTNVFNPYTRIMELKSLIMESHKRGLGVILDVVYNHTFRTEDSYLNTIAPYYFYRVDSHMNFCNGSGCGNEIDSQAPMARRLIIDSLKYLLEEYKVDGFRFDLVGLYDKDTITLLSKELKEIYPQVILYGEPWTGGISGLAHDKQMLKGSQKGLDFGLFNDEFRNHIKGDNDGHEIGFIQGDFRKYHDMIRGLMGSIDIGPYIGFTKEPHETINYFNAHDNLIFQDKLVKTMPTIGKTDQERLTLMAFTLILTAFGIPFFHSGNEFMRTKNMVHNSYNMPDSINQIDWELKIKNHRLFENVTQLIKLRNNLSCFHTYTQEEIVKNFTFETIGNSGLKYSINNNFIKDKYKGITVYLNNSSHDIHSKDILKKNQILICDSLYVNYDGVENHKYVIDDKVTIPKHGILIFGSINDK